MPPSKASRLPHLFISQQPTATPFTNPSGGGSRLRLPLRERIAHGQDLQAQLQAVSNNSQLLIAHQKMLATENGLPVEYGVYVAFQSELGFKLSAGSLEDSRSKTELLATKILAVGPSSELAQAVVFIPKGKLANLERKVAQYLTEETHNGAAKNKSLIESISKIGLATLRDLWTDSSLFPSAKAVIWWEVWLRAGANEDERAQILATFRKQAAKFTLLTSRQEIKFPENTILLLHASAAQIETFIFPLNILAELRQAKETAHFFLNLKPSELEAWVDDTVSRIAPPPADAPAICLLDTGVNNAHPLLTQALNSDDMDAYNSAWGKYDHQGHGTEMAGVGLYGDLSEIMTSNGPFALTHKLESVKMLPPDGHNSNPPELYGDITKECVARAETFAPYRNRAICLTITATDSRDQGQPSSWSAALDSICSGAEEEDSPHRLILVSAGNVQNAIKDYPNINYTDGIHDPGQSWNALTIGAYTEKSFIDPNSDNSVSVPLAPHGGLCPTSTTSLIWAKEWPFKPDIVLEGGNLARSPSFPEPFIEESLRMLTTRKDWEWSNLLTSTGDTSAATAQAARMGAIILARYPDLWPETVRALLVHSAHWTSQMQSDFSDSIANRLRCYGYGVPNLTEALFSASNSLTLVAQNCLQPFTKEGSNVKAHEAHIHQLPWPSEQLLALGELDVELRVTLSYFIEPNPSRRSNQQKHSYASHGLRFETKTSSESLTNFNNRVNGIYREEGENYGTSDSSAWMLGPRMRVRGSLHSDVWRGTAANLATKGYIAVYPVSGWWKDLKRQQKWDSQTRYSLIVTIKTPDVGIDIYTPVANLVMV